MRILVHVHPVLRLLWILRGLQPALLLCKRERKGTMSHHIWFPELDGNSANYSRHSDERAKVMPSFRHSVEKVKLILLSKANRPLTKENLARLPHGTSPIDTYISSPTREAHETRFVDAQTGENSSDSERTRRIEKMFQTISIYLGSGTASINQTNDTEKGICGDRRT